MRQILLREGASELSYEIREIVKKARLIEKNGQKVFWENIGDPIQKNNKLPDWIKENIIDLIKDDLSYGYSDSKGVLATREFLANLNNKRKGTTLGLFQSTQQCAQPDNSDKALHPYADDRIDRT